MGMFVRFSARWIFVRKRLRFHGWVYGKEKELLDELLSGVEAFEEGDFGYATEATEDGDSDALAINKLLLFSFASL